MADSMLEEVEKRLSKSLSLEPVQVNRLALKSSLPFTILNMEGSSPVLHLFEIPSDKAIFKTTPSEHPKFGVVTMNGCIMVYDIMFRCITWKQQTSLEQVSWGILSWYKHVDPAIMMHSRQRGFHLVKPQNDVASNNNSNELLSTETHIGFCKPYLCSDQSVIVPIGSSKIGIHKQGQKTVQACHSFDATIMAVKEISSDTIPKYIICANEDGFITLLQAKRKEESEAGFEIQAFSKFLLPKYKDKELELQPVGMCIEGEKNIFVIGTNLKYQFLVKWGEKEEPMSLKPFGKKILPTDGVSCMAMKKGRGILAAGCYDGTVRIFGFPEMNQISTINYHKSQINTLLFINEKLGKDGRWYLICGANNSSGLSVWNMQSRKIE